MEGRTCASAGESNQLLALIIFCSLFPSKRLKAMVETLHLDKRQKQPHSGNTLQRIASKEAF